MEPKKANSTPQDEQDVPDPPDLYVTIRDVQNQRKSEKKDRLPWWYIGVGLFALFAMWFAIIRDNSYADRKGGLGKSGISVTSRGSSGASGKKSGGSISATASKPSQLEYASAGLSRVTPEQVQTLHDYNVSTGLVRSLRQVGIQPEVTGLVELRKADIDEAYVLGLDASGYMSLTIEKLILLKRAGVTPASKSSVEK
jgi:hypothetical protein